MPAARLNSELERIAALRVLVAEPNAQLREIIRDILIRGIGVGEVLECRNGDDALSKLRTKSYDVVLADTLMTPSGALELTQKIRAGVDGVDPFTPVIAMSGMANLDEIIRVRDAGATDYVAKPLSAKILDLRLHAVIEHPRPFIRSDDFFGPDRRRHASDAYDGADRRKADRRKIEERVVRK